MHAQVPTHHVTAAYHAVLFATALMALRLSLTAFLPRPAARSQDQHAILGSALTVAGRPQANACHTKPSQRHLRADGSDSAAFARSTAE